MSRLREAKMHAARRLMEQAAVDLAYEEGIGAVTVDRVCATAMMSRSTFFNYFPSLDQAIFGAPLSYDRELTARVLAQHSRDLVVAACLIVMESVRGQVDDELTRKRFALFIREPGTTNAVSWTSHESRQGLENVIADWLREHPESARLADADPETEARMTVGFSIALGDEVMRLVGDEGGELPFDVAHFRTVRERMARISLPDG